MISESMLGDERGVREPAPAPVGIGEKLTWTTFEHLPRLRLVGDLGRRPARHEQGYSLAGSSANRPFEPRLHGVVSRSWNGTLTPGWLSNAAGTSTRSWESAIGSPRLPAGATPCAGG